MLNTVDKAPFIYSMYSRLIITTQIIKKSLLWHHRQFSQWPIHLPVNVNCKCYGIAALKDNIEFKSSKPCKMNRKKMTGSIIIRQMLFGINPMIAYQSALVLELYIEG